MQQKIIVGADTDSKGCFCFLSFEQQKSYFVRVPSYKQKINGTNRTFVDIPVLLTNMQRALQQTGAMHVAFYLERQHAAPMQGVSSMFSFGRTYGTLLTCAHASCMLAGIPYEIYEVYPRKWKQVMGVTQKKETNIDKANKLGYELRKAWKLKKHMSASEAFLIALYGAQQEGLEINKNWKLGGVWE